MMYDIVGLSVSLVFPPPIVCLEFLSSESRVEEVDTAGKRGGVDE